MRSGTAQIFLCTMSVISLWSVDVSAQETDVPATSQIVCTSTAGERQECPGDTAGGVLLVRSTGSAACLLGRTWGYDDKGVWVSDGCSGEFVLGQHRRCR